LIVTKRLAIYLMAGPETPDLAVAAVAGGADLIEVGIPFSDPLADGPVIREAARRALARGMHAAACLDCIAEIRSQIDVPIVPMTYSSILEAYGYQRFQADARAAGATSLIVADLPVEMLPDLRRVQLVALTSPAERIRLAAASTDGWLYLVAAMGATGTRDAVSLRLPALVQRARNVATVPLLAGFGIATAEHAAGAARVADGVVVGTRAVEVANRAGPSGLREFVASLRAAVDDVDSTLEAVT
jgi:tryptophan synthase alpha chain